jgi:hypothetical protein
MLLCVVFGDGPLISGSVWFFCAAIVGILVFLLILRVMFSFILCLCVYMFIITTVGEQIVVVYGQR